MALKITKGSDPIQVESITTCIYAPPGVGKSSLGYSADAPLLLDFDSGAHRAIGRKDTVRVSAWGDVVDMTAEDLAAYKTIVVDTAGRALDVLTTDIIRRNPKMGRAGALTLQGFGQLKSEFVAWTKSIRSFGKDVVLLVHSEEQRSNDELVERLDVQGGSKNEIYKCADVMGRLKIINNVRQLNFNPTDTAFGKNPTQLEPMNVPTPPGRFLGEIIESIKGKLNELSEEQQTVMDLMSEWAERINKAQTAQEFNRLIDESQGLDARIKDRGKALLVKTAGAKGFVFDRNSGSFREAA